MSTSPADLIFLTVENLIRFSNLNQGLFESDLISHALLKQDPLIKLQHAGRACYLRPAVYPLESFRPYPVRGQLLCFDIYRLQR